MHSGYLLWNKIGRFHGPRSPRVREFMLDQANYDLEYYTYNRSKGALLPQKYKPPVTFGRAAGGAK